MTLCDRSASHMLSMIASIYCVFIYSIAFSLEMWFIITTPVYNHNYGYIQDEDTLYSVFPFILAAIYFVVVVISLLLMLGIIIKSIMCLMSWLIGIIFIFFPECGFVLYISIYQWVSLLANYLDLFTNSHHSCYSFRELIQGMAKLSFVYL